MDFLIIIALSILTPFYLNVSDKAFDTSFGVSVTENTNDYPFANYKSAAVEGGNVLYEILDTNFSGANKISYDTILQYSINSNKFNKRLHFGTRMSWAPLEEVVNVSLQAPTSLRPTTSEIHFYEMPSFGFFTEFDLLKINENKYLKSSISPYLGFSLMRVGYAGSDDYDKAAQYDGAFKLFYGINFRNASGWNLFVEGSTYSVDIMFVESLKQNLSINVSKIKIGASYTFLDDISKDRVVKDTTYSDILNIINPNISEIKEKEKQLAEEKEQQFIEEALKQKEAELKKQQEAEEQAKKTQENIDSTKNQVKKEKKEVTIPTIIEPQEIAPEGDFSDWEF